MEVANLDEIINFIKNEAARDITGDNEDFSAYDYSGGNFDDAYELGLTDGSIGLARHLLETYFNNGDIDV